MEFGVVHMKAGKKLNNIGDINKIIHESSVFPIR